MNIFKLTDKGCRKLFHFDEFGLLGLFSFFADILRAGATSPAYHVLITRDCDILGHLLTYSEQRY